MKKSWLVFLSIPILAFASYPIYEDDIVSHPPESAAQGSSAEKDQKISKKSEKEPIQENGEDSTSQKQIRKPGMRDRPYLRNKKRIGVQAKPESSSSEKQQPTVSKRDPVKRNSATQDLSPRLRHRKNPNRPQVIHRDGKKKSQELSKIEADAEEKEEGLSTHQSEERADSPSQN